MTCSVISVIGYFFVCFCIVSLSEGRIDRTRPFSTCKPPKGNSCVKIRQCPFFDELLNRTSTNRPRIIYTIIKKHLCDIDDNTNTPYVCCNKTTSPYMRTNSWTTPSPILEKLPKRLNEHPNAHLLPNNICGPLFTSSRITYGTKTEINEYPWMALIAYHTNEGLDFRCSGTVINEIYVLTAAHCVTSNIVGVRLGEHNLDTSKDCKPEGNYCAPPTQDFHIENIKVHPGYNSKTYVNDIALIRLATPANFSYSNVQPICLPIEDTNLDGKLAIVAGWGVTQNGNKSPEIMKVSLPIHPITDCQRKYRRFAPITYNQICAGGYEGKSSCGGDSGGPMKCVGFVDGSPRFIQYGIVSYGPTDCGMNGRPGIYTRVSKYMEWILNNLKPYLDD